MPLTLVCPAPEWNLHEDGSLIHLDLPQAVLRQMSLFPGSICIPLPARHACSLTSDLALLSRQTRQYPEAYGETVGNLIQAAVRPIMRSPDQGAVSPHSPEYARGVLPSGYLIGENTCIQSDLPCSSK